MISMWWSAVLLATAVLMPAAKSESTAYPVIPNHLLECYTDDGIYHRANRIPNTFEYFLDLLRKVESGPTSRNMNARELSMALLHYLKLDGIQTIRYNTKFFPSHIVPFAPSGAEYFKHRLTVVGLVPRIEQTFMRAFNETLTKKEMCNLHFMLSYSIDPYKRDNERCSPLFESTARRETNPVPSSEWDPYQNVHSYYRRQRRRIEHDNDVNRVSKQDKSTGKEKRSSKNSDAEEFKVETLKPQEEKDKFTIGDQELLSGVERHVGMQSLVQRGDFGRFGGRPNFQTGHLDEGFYTGVIPGIPISECPVVNGIITTPSGSLAIGTVVAGIAAGLNPEDIPPFKLSVEPSELESPSDRVKNVWATTLAGTVADTLTSSALLDTDTLQIIKGGWNDSTDPKWYLLSNNQFKHLTEVALRGGLDGLLLGMSAREWTSKFSGFKLSQMLQTYYDGLWGNIGAKNRVQLRPQYAPDELFRKQVHLMSLVLKKQKTNVLTVLDYRQIAREAVGKVTQHIQTMDDREKSYIGSFLSTKIENFVSLVAVIDSSWGYESLNKIFELLRYAQVIGVAGSNITIICGKDGRVLVSSENGADFYLRFTKDMLFDNCTRGLDFPLAFDTLDTIYRKVFYDEKTSNQMNTNAQVAVLFPFEPLLRDDSYIIEKSQNFKSNFPDVRLMVASNGRPDSFQSLVRDQKDLFSLVPYTADPDLKSVKEFADGVKQSKSFQRISRPSCGSYFDDDSPGTETRVTRDVGLGNIVYYRLLPQYFFTQHGLATVTIKSKQRAPLTVCHSREMERPTGPTPRGNLDTNTYPDFPPEASLYGRQTSDEPDGPVQCKTITADYYKIEMNNPCEGSSALHECKPLYISLSPPLPETISIICPTCRLPSNVQYEIAVTGLTCYNNAAVRTLAPLLLALLLVHLFK